MIKRIFFILVYVLLCIQNVDATYISMSMTMNLPQTVDSQDFDLNIALNNIGDEPAYDVSIELQLPPGFSSEPQTIGLVHTNIIYYITIPIKASSQVKNGRYTPIVLLKYSDSNSYPFSNVAPINLNYKSNILSKTSIYLPRLNITDSGVAGFLQFELANMDETPHEYTVVVHLPHELKAAVPMQKVQVAGRSRMPLKIPVYSQGARENSMYQVVVTADFEEDIHFSASTVGLITVNPDPAKIQSHIPKTMPLISLIILCIAYLVAQFIPNKKEDED